MVRIRKLQRRGYDNVWHSDAYALEKQDSSVVLRYSPAWEYLGGRYNRLVQEQRTSLEGLEAVLSGESVRWLPVEIFDDDETQVMAALDRECNVPQTASRSVGPRSSRRIIPTLITLQAQVVSGKLQLQPPPASPIRVYGNQIYLEDGRQLQITLVPAVTEPRV